MTGDISSLLIVLLVCTLWVMARWARRHHTQLDPSSATTLRQRLLKPRTPEDCPACRRDAVRSAVAPAQPPAVRPWRELKSRRGAHKRIATAGFACPNPCAGYLFHPTR